MRYARPRRASQPHYIMDGLGLFFPDPTYQFNLPYPPPPRLALQERVCGRIELSIKVLKEGLRAGMQESFFTVHWVFFSISLSQLILMIGGLNARYLPLEILLFEFPVFCCWFHPSIHEADGRKGLSASRKTTFLMIHRL